MLTNVAVGMRAGIGYWSSNECKESQEELMSHTLRMLLGCLLPLLLIFLLPLLGLGEEVALFMALVLMFACHLLMIGGHRRGHPHESNRQTEQEDSHAHP